MGLRVCDDADQFVADIADLHVRHDTFPGEVLMELAADALALAVAGVERSAPTHRFQISVEHLERFVADRSDVG